MLCQLVLLSPALSLPLGAQLPVEEIGDHKQVVSHLVFGPKSRV